MTDLASTLSQEHGIPVLDGVTCAVKLCENLVALGLKTSKSGGYARPRAKAYSGVFARFSPGGTKIMADDREPIKTGSGDT
jgi:allantoin racemase